VNKPEVAILGLGRGAMKPVVRGDAIQPRLLMPMGLSYDHRVIDGGSAARFIVDLVRGFENFNEADVKL
jgi:pyruvate dehydrogenase E2 component (dihydrolipoamide acetyltransferase)